MNTVRLSNRQYSLLKFMDGAAGKRLNLDELAGINQLTAGANKRRGWITETKAKDGVQLTSEGRQALRSFEEGDFMRSVARMKFSSFLSLDVYEPAKAKPKPVVTVMKRKGAAA